MSHSTTGQPSATEILADPLRNHGVAFTEAQRRALGLTGRLPSAVLSLDQQADRAYKQLQAQAGDLAKNVYLEQLHDRNEVLYFKVLLDHLTELLPVVYDPTVGDAIEHYSDEYRRPRGIFLSIDRPGDIESAFGTLGLGPRDVDLIVCSDAEEILGIGDWGVGGGIQISVGKLAVYTAAAGVDPRRVIPVSLDVGTDNEGLLNDPLYLGNRHARVRGKAYDDFIARYLEAVSSLFPNALLHFEDFGASNARRILDAYRGKYRIFNDDVQGTAAVVLAGLLNALKVTGTRWRDQRVVVFGGGTAGAGIADRIRDHMVGDGLDQAQATARIWIVDLPGLLTDDMGDGLLEYQRPYARPAAEAGGWPRTPAQIDPSAATRWPQMAALRQARTAGIVALETVVAQVKPTILIGTSTAHGAFTREVVETMSAGTPRPVIFPISNPTSQIEAVPSDIIAWSGGKALVCTGLPIPPLDYAGVRYEFGEANNALLYPGLGLGTIVAGASHVTDGMLLAAAEAVAGQADVSQPGASLLPLVENLRASSATAAIAVARAAVADGVASRNGDELVQAVQDAMWQPVYPDPTEV
jgi:malate dehydrogenase (oxaloacetate-decarboxylating)